MYMFYWIWLGSFISVLITQVNRRLGSYLAVAISIFAFILAGFRPDDFPDKGSYELIFEAVSVTDVFSSSFRDISSEFGFNVLSKGILWASESAEITFLFYSFVSFVLLIFLSCKMGLDFSLVWLMYYSLSYLTKDLGQIRVAISCLLVVLMYQFGLSRKSFIVLIVNAISFQALSFITLLSYLYPKLKLQTIVIGISVAYAMSFLINYSVIESFSPRYYLIERYSGTEYVNAERASFVPILRTSLVFIYLMWCNRFYKLGQANIYILSVYMGLLSYITLFNVPILAQRIGIYFVSADIFALAILYKKVGRVEVLAFCVAYSLASFLYVSLTASHLDPANITKWGFHDLLF